MPRGGGRKVTHNTAHRFVLSYAFSSLTRRLLFVAAVPHDEKKSNPSFFFPLLSRASLSEESISSFSKMMIPLSACAAEYSIGRSGFPKRSLLKRERETNGCVFRSPQQKQGKKREKTNTLISPNEKKCKREEKKTNRQPKHIEERKRKS